MSAILGAARANVLLAPLSACLALCAAVVVARVLEPEIYADYATLMAMLAWLLLLSEAGCNIGLSRYLGEAAALHARLTLYWTLQRRRWLYVLGVSAVGCFLGPLWAGFAGLDPERWQLPSFVLVGLLAGVVLHGQLASSALSTVFQHKQLLLLAQLMTVLRAACLASLAAILKEPVALLVALLLIATLESRLLHRAATKYFLGENSPLPLGFATAAQSHGLVSLFDKLTTSIAGGPFLLLVLAGVYGRAELALLAIATDLLQKVLSIAGLPITGLVLPLMHESREDAVRFKYQLERLGGLVVSWFSVVAGAVVVFVPLGFPLLLGDKYAAAVSVALIWLFPLFAESAIRMVWGAALLTVNDYRWLTVYNTVFFVVALAVLFFAKNMDLLALLACLGGVKLVMGLIIVGRAGMQGLAPAASRPLGILLASAACCSISLFVQFETEGMSNVIRLAAGGAIYCGTMLVLLKFIPLIPEPALQTLFVLAGRHAVVLKRFLASPSGGRCP